MEYPTRTTISFQSWEGEFRRVLHSQLWSGVRYFIVYCSLVWMLEKRIGETSSLSPARRLKLGDAWDLLNLEMAGQSNILWLKQNSRSYRITANNFFCKLLELFNKMAAYAGTRRWNSPFHGSWKVAKLLHETEAKVALAQLGKWK